MSEATFVSIYEHAKRTCFHHVQGESSGCNPQWARKWLDDLFCGGEITEDQYWDIRQACGWRVQLSIFDLIPVESNYVYE